jgi:transcriptional regulator with XRE-family HTH domain
LNAQNHGRQDLAGARAVISDRGWPASIIMDKMSTMVDRAPAALAQRIAAQARNLRRARGLSLDAVSRRSGVSRSMISLVERGETSATAVVLERLATGLGVPLARLFDEPAGRSAKAQPVARGQEQPRWRDPASGYVRRNVSPALFPSPIRIVEVHFPAGARVSYETGARDVEVHQQVWVLSGRLELTVGRMRYRLAAGDCLAMRLDAPIVFANRTRSATRYAVVLSSVAVGDAFP